MSRRLWLANVLAAIAMVAGVAWLCTTVFGMLGEQTDWSKAWEYRETLWRGWWITLAISIAALGGSIVFGLLFMLVALPMMLLSGGETPVESQPEWLQTVMQAVPSTHFVAFAQAILFRDAGIDIVWPQFALVAGMGALFFAFAAFRFRASIANMQV